MIELVGNKILKTILSATNRNKYYSIILDCTPDISHTEQMSLVSRYVDVVGENVKIEEHFLCFIELNSTTSENLTNVVVQKLEEINLPLENCRGQAYDNGANMSGKNTGLQRRILDLNPLALFLPCASHSLNLVLCDSAKSCKEFFTFFGNIQKIYAIFSSTKRWDVLKKHCKKVVKYPSETRWESKISSIETVKTEFVGIVLSLEVILDGTIGNASSCAEIQGILTAMQTFEFALCTEIRYEVLVQANIVSKYLQKADIDVATAVDLIKGLLGWLHGFRHDGFKQCLDTAAQAVRDCNQEQLDISSEFISTRRRPRKTAFYEPADEQIENSQKRFETGVFNVMMDTFIFQVDERFFQIKNYFQKFGVLLQFASLSLDSPDEPKLLENCIALEENLGNVVNGPQLKMEIISFLNIPNKEQNGPFHSLKYIVKHRLIDCYANLYVALRIILTMPVSVASAERSFSKLKLIKTYLRSTMSQYRLNGLAIMSIENLIWEKLKL